MASIPRRLEPRERWLVIADGFYERRKLDAQGQGEATLRNRHGLPVAQRRTYGGGPFTPDAVNRLIKRIGARADFVFPVHTQMLRHASGFALANAGHDARRM